MPEWIARITVGEVVVFLTGIVVAGGFLKKIWKPLKGIGAFLEDWNGKPERLDAAGNVVEVAVPGMGAKMRTLESQVQRIHHETTPNHGGSLKDAVNRIETRVNADGAKLTEHLQQTAKWHPMLETLHGDWSDPPHTATQ